MHLILSQDFNTLFQINAQIIINTIITNRKVTLIFAVLEIVVIAFLLLFANKRKNIYHSEKVKLTDKISVPKPVGEGQHGTSWWLDKKDYNKIFKCNVIDRNKEYNNCCFDSGGVIVNFEKEGNIEKYYYIDDNIHILVLGSSGSGKSRSIIIPAITMLRTSTERMSLSVMLKANYTFIQLKN